MKKLLFILSIAFATLVQGQNVVGYWYGNANVKNGGSTNNYLVELILKQTQSNVQGIINYYFKNTFRSIKLNGNFNKATRQLMIYNIPVTYYGSSASLEVDCMMDFNATLRVAQAGSNLNGRFVGKAAYRNTCPEIFFELKLNKDASNQDSILTALREYKETYQVWQPSATDTLVAATVIQRPVVNYVVTNEYKQRQNEIADEIIVDSDSVQVDFYDNGEVDGDSISVFYNQQLMTFNRLLSARSLHFTIGLDSTKEVNELTMFADNLGSIPPNTALMLVSDGKKRYQVRLSSNLQKNASVLIRRKKTPKP